MFHGGKNYVANYIFLMNVARQTYYHDLAYASENVPYPYPNNESEAVIRDRLEGLYISLGYILPAYDIKDTKENRARFVAGLAVHTMMDAYAHRSYICEGPGIYVAPDDSSAKDNRNNEVTRYNTAKAAALKAIYYWHNNISPSGLEFYQPNTHSQNKFLMDKFYTYVSKADPSAISAHPQWYYNRSVD